MTTREYRPLRDITIFTNDMNGDFIVAKHTSHANVKVSFGYSEVYTFVSNYQSSSHYEPLRAYVYLDALIEKYRDLLDEAKKNTDEDQPDWEAIHADTIERLKDLRTAKWHQLGQ